MIEKKIEITMLYDFYSQLLTERQRDIIDLYYNQDLSLAEIAEELQISRQAVYDAIKRTEKILYDYEDKLKLFQLFDSKMSNIKRLKEEVYELEQEINLNSPSERIKQIIINMKLLFDELLNIESSR